MLVATALTDLCQLFAQLGICPFVGGLVLHIDAVIVVNFIALHQLHLSRCVAVLALVLKTLVLGNHLLMQFEAPAALLGIVNRKVLEQMHSLQLMVFQQDLSGSF